MPGCALREFFADARHLCCPGGGIASADLPSGHRPGINQILGSSLWPHWVGLDDKVQFGELCGSFGFLCLPSFMEGKGLEAEFWWGDPGSGLYIDNGSALGLEHLPPKR